MRTVERLFNAARRLSPAQLLQLRKKLERLEDQLWQAELKATSEALKERGLKDSDIDRMVMKRRREGRR